MYWSASLPEDAIRVCYRLADGSIRPPEELYCCTQCSLLLSRWNLMDEVDSYFCPQCVESLPSTEALACRICCFRCFDCPRCQHVLTYLSSRRDVMSTEKNPEEAKGAKEDSKSAIEEAKGVTEKTDDAVLPDGESTNTGYRLTCQFCHWESTKLALHNDTLERLIASLMTRHRDTLEAKRLASLSMALAKPAKGLETAGGKQKPGLSAGPVDVNAEIKNLLPYGRPLNLTDSMKSNRKDLLQTVQVLLEAKQKRIDTFSIWDLQVNGLMDSVHTTDSQFGMRLPANELLNVLVAPSRQMVAQLKALIDVTDLKQIPSQEQRLAAKFGTSATHVDELLPIPKALLTKRSLRCETCKKYLVRTQLNPSAPFRLNNSAINFLPRIVLISLHPSTESFMNSLNLPEDLESRFFSLHQDQTAYLNLELANIFDSGNAARLNFQFTSSPDDTVIITTQDFETSVSGYDEFKEEEDLAAKRKQRPVVAEKASPAIYERRLHKLGLCFDIKVREGIAPGSVAKCSFKLHFSPTPATPGFQLEPVCILGRTI